MGMNNMWNDVLYISNVFKRNVKFFIIEENFLHIYVEKNILKSLLIFLKYDTLLLYEQLLDIWAVDVIGQEKRFEINYLMLSVRFNKRIIIHTNSSEDEYLVSVIDIFKSAGWLEREVWDLYGVLFFNNNDLRRILTDYGFEGHPFRKDFPLTGYLECRYDDSAGRIALEPVELSQEYRVFNFISPWDDEK
jgi:NADH-quinone oxidoreductase subunit C